jgi:hypothetical protein
MMYIDNITYAFEKRRKRNIIAAEAYIETVVNSLLNN